MGTAIINGKIITPYRVLEDHNLLIENGIIRQVAPAQSDLDCEEIIDAEGCYVSPGFIDLHTHGGGGHDFMDGTAEAIIGAAKAHLAHGTTSIVPTTLTSTDEDLFNTFHCYQEAKRTMKDGPNLLGLHLEGPYFSQNQRGAQDPSYIRDPDPAHYMKILDACPDIIRVSVAPELHGATELADELRKRGILPSIAHSDALLEDVLSALEHGFSLYCLYLQSLQ